MTRSLQQMVPSCSVCVSKACEPGFAKLASQAVSARQSQQDFARACALATADRHCHYTVQAGTHSRSLPCTSETATPFKNRRSMRAVRRLHTHRLMKTSETDVMFWHVAFQSDDEWVHLCFPFGQQVGLSSRPT